MIAPDLLPPPDMRIQRQDDALFGWTAESLADVLKLAQFGAWAANTLRLNLGSDLSGEDAQDAMQRSGVLVKVEVIESCGDDCMCAEYGLLPGDCLKYPPGVAQIVKECGK